VQLRVSEKLVRFGERYGIDWLIYNPLEFRRYHQFAKADAPGVADSILGCFPTLRSANDVGCGTGTMAAEFRRRGIDVTGCERAAVGRLFARVQGVPCRRFDLRRDPPAILPRRELAYCFEVAEHLPPQLGDRLVSFLAAFDTVIFSAAHPGQGGIGHINLQPKSYWIERFEQHNLSKDEQLTNCVRDRFLGAGVSPWLPQNVMVFRTS
jgi:SAM-dependent methyltransferase